MNEVLARGEIMRRFSLSGVAALKAASDAEKKKVQQHQSTMCVARPEGDSRAGQPWINLSSGGSYDRDAAAGYGAIDAGAGTAHRANGRSL